jgi:hypothetical protein
MRPVLLALLIGIAPSAAAQSAAQSAAPPAAPAAARAEVLATIDSFLAGLRTKDTVLMARHVDSLTRMTLLRPGPAGSRVMLLSAAEFMRVVSRPEQPALDEPIRNAVVHVDGDLASVWAEYQVRIDGKVSHCGFDAFHLARLGGRWKILNVSDTFRRTGCGEPWP